MGDQEKKNEIKSCETSIESQMSNVRIKRGIS